MAWNSPPPSRSSAARAAARPSPSALQSPCRARLLKHLPRLSRKSELILANSASATCHGRSVRCVLQPRVLPQVGGLRCRLWSALPRPSSLARCRADGGCQISRHPLLLPRLLPSRRHAGADRYARRLARLRARFLLRQLSSRPLNPCGLTSSGAVFRADLPDNAASPLLPDGTVILAYNPKTGDASVLRITNAGPYSGERKLDVSRAAAEKLGFRKQGVAALVISVLQSPTKAEANYVRRRVYPIVPGYLGRFATVDIALDTAQVRFDLREEGKQPDDDTGAAMEVAALEGGLVPRPQLAVSPSLARELVILRLPPRPVSPGRAACGGPAARAGPASRQPSRLHGPAVTCTNRRDASHAGRRQLDRQRGPSCGSNEAEDRCSHGAGPAPRLPILLPRRTPSRMCSR